MEDRSRSHPSRPALRAAAAVGLIGVVIALAFVVSRSTSREHTEPRTDALALAGSTSLADASDELLAAPLAASETTRANGAIAPVSTQRGLQLVILARVDANSTKLLPGIHMVVGIGRPPVGAANPDAFLVASGLALEACTEPYHEVVTDESGRATFEFPAPELEIARSDPAARAWVRIVEPGHQERTHARRLPAEGVDSIEIPVFVHPGATIRGRVVDESDAPVAAQVSMRAFDFEGKLGMGSSGWSGADGWFEVFPFRAGVQNLLADAGDLGTAVLRDLDLDAPRAEPIVLRVHGPGIVRGRVLDDGGRAVPGLDLGIWLASLDDEVGSFVLPEPAHSHAELEGRGRTWVTLTTDANGVFGARGLRADRYVVRTGTSRFGPYPRLLTPASVASDGTELELRLERTVLAVRIVDVRGEPWTGFVATGSASGWLEKRADVPDRWPDEATLVVVPVASDAERGADRSPRLLATRDASGAFVVPCRAGTRYRVGLLGGAQTWRPFEAAVPPLGGRVEVVLTAEVDASRGALEMRVRDAAGAALTTGYSVRIEDVDDGTTLVFDHVESWESGSGLRPLPPGTYRVVVRAEPSVDDHHGTLMESAAHGRSESIVDVRRDQTTTLVAMLPAGARIRAKITGSALEEDAVAVRASCPGCTFGGPFEFWTERATTSLLADARWPIAVDFPYEMTGSSAAGTHLGDWLPLGKVGTSELLPAGRYRFEARLPGGRTASTEVVLVDGQTTEVELVIDPR